MKILKTIKNLFKPDPLVLFFPNKAMRDECGVSKIYSTIHNGVGNKILFHEAPSKGFFEYFDESQLATKTDAAIIFAHTDDTQSSILTFSNAKIYSHWFFEKEKNNTFDFLFVFACKGALLMSNPTWHLCSKNWISFKEDLHVYVDSERARKLHKAFFYKIIRRVKGVSNFFDFENAIRHSFHEIFNEIYKNLSEEDGDVLMLMHLELAYGSLDTSNQN